MTDFVSGPDSQILKFLEPCMQTKMPTQPTLTAVERQRVIRHLIHLAGEVEELIEAFYSEDLHHTAQELTDVDYMVTSLFRMFGLPRQSLFDEVHRANMSKVLPDGTDVYRDAEGCVLKGPYYTKPDIAKAIRGRL